MALLARLRSLIDRLRGSGLAAESAWGLVLELATLLGMVLSFTLLGRSLGPAGYGGYASLYAIVGPLVTLAASGVTLALLQHVVRDGEPLAQTARSCLTLTLALGVLLTLVGTGIAALVVESLTAVAITTILLTEFLTSPMVHVAATTVQAATGFIGAAKIRLVLVIVRAVVLVLLFVVGRVDGGDPRSVRAAGLRDPGDPVAPAGRRALRLRVHTRDGCTSATSRRTCSSRRRSPPLRSTTTATSS